MGGNLHVPSHTSSNVLSLVQQTNPDIETIKEKFQNSGFKTLTRQLQAVVTLVHSRFCSDVVSSSEIQ